jgi:hypothetical protein
MFSFSAPSFRHYGPLAVAFRASRLLPLRDPDLPHPIERFAISEPFIFERLRNLNGITMLPISDAVDLIDQLLAPAIRNLIDPSTIRAVFLIQFNN